MKNHAIAKLRPIFEEFKKVRSTIQRQKDWIQESFKKWLRDEYSDKLFSHDIQTLIDQLDQDANQIFDLIKNASEVFSEANRLK